MHTYFPNTVGFVWLLLQIMDRNGVIGIATCYGLNGPVIETLWGGKRFSAPVQTGPGAHSAFYTMITGSFPRVKRPRAWR